MRPFIRSSKLAILSSLVISSGLPMLQAQETLEKEDEPTTEDSKVAPNPLQELKKINETTYQLGEITIDKKKRSIHFDAVTEITAALVEYAVVTDQGKIHESLFITKARPIHLNIAFKLLGYKENKSLFPVFEKNMATEKYQTATDEEKEKSRFNITVSWQDKKTKKEVSHNINQLIQNAETEKSPNKADWSYGGSFIHQGQFVAELTNDLIAIFTDRGAIANYAGKGREDDTLWHAVSKKLPIPGTKVTITITPKFPANKK